MKFLKIIAFSLTAIASMDAIADEVYLCMAPGGEKQSVYGTLRKETYDVAIKFGPEMAGVKVLGLRVPMTTDSNLSGLKGFISTKLTTGLVDGKRVNTPDVAEVPANLSGGWLTATFQQSYTIPADGLYVGYTFTIDEIDDFTRKPVVGVDQPTANGFFYRASSSQTKWLDASTDYKFTSSISVLVEDDRYSASSASPVLQNKYWGAAGKSFEVNASFINYGGPEIRSIGYSWSIGSQSGEGSIDYSEPLDVIYGYEYPVVFNVKAPLNKGFSNMELEITSINGNPNKSKELSAIAEVSVVSKKPAYRPLVEEYTGTWCGYCTAGMASMEYMSRVYPYDFVGVAYHHGNGTIPDPMQVTITDPNTPGALPAAYINRVGDRINPYYGPSTGSEQARGFGFLPYWENLRQGFTPVDIQLECVWDEENPDIIDAEANVTFVEDVQGYFGIGWILVSDKIENPDPANPWIQQNNNQGIAIDIPELKIFSEGGFAIPNLTYRDVALRNSGKTGLAGSLPPRPIVDKCETFEFKVDASQIKGDTGVDLIQNRDDLRVVAIVINNATGGCLNAAQYRMNGNNDTKLHYTSATTSVTRMEYYSLDGIRRNEPAKGLNIVVTKYSDGSSRSKKIYIP